MGAVSSEVASMIATIHSSCFASALEQLQSRFLGILPRIERHAKIYFRHVPSRQKRTDLVAETVALAWKWFVRLAEKGRDGTQFPMTLASYAAKAVRSGRRVCGQERARDAQQRHGFCVGKLPDFSTESTNPLAEALTDNTRSPVPDQVQFRCDFPAWLRTRTQRDRRLIERMAMRERTKDLARKFRLSESRIRQLRQDFHEDWNRFGNEAMTVA
jgi:hypothetical protein